MKIVTLLLCISILLGSTVVGTSHADERSILKAKQEGTEKTLTKEAFQRVEPVLKGLRADQSIHTTKLEWPVFPIKEGKKVVGLLAISDGWAGDLSGNVVGAISGLGAPFAIVDGAVYGQHVYGYVVQAGIFIPRYVVQIKAVIIGSSEYEALKAKKTPNIGWSYRPGEQEKIFFKDAAIAQVKEIGTGEEKYSAVSLGSPTSTSRVVGLYSREKYDKISPLLAKLSPGIDTLDAVKTLNGIIVANHGGVEFTFFIDGFLNYKGEYRLTKTTANGVYSVWPFGYVEDGKEVPKMALIFKNGLLKEVAPYTSRSQIEENLDK